MKWRNTVIVLVVVLAIGIGVGAGYAAWGDSTKIVYVPQPSLTNTDSESPVLPEHYSLSFTTTPNGKYTFPIYLRTDWILHINWWIDEPDSEVALGFVAPCGDQYGYTGSVPVWQPGLIHRETEGSAVLDLAKYFNTNYQFDNGYYEFIAYGGRATNHWHVSYWIEN